MRIYTWPDEEIVHPGIRLAVEGQEVPLHEATVSAYPFNRRWPGYQRSRDQTEAAYFASFETDGPVCASVEWNRPVKTAVVRPLSRGVTPIVEEDRISFALPGPGHYTVECDGTHGALHLFIDAPRETSVDWDDPDTIAFGKGFHDAGTIVLKSGQTLYLAEGAVVYGSVFAKDADHIRILGRGILDNSRNKEQILYEAPPGDGSFALTNAIRTHTVQLEYCTNVVIEDITIRDSLVYNIRPIGCNDLDIDNVKIIGCWRYNSDGIDMHNCRRVHISGCFLRTYDDSICVKGFDYTQDEAEMTADGRDATEFVDALIERCVIWCDWGHSLEIGAETRAREIARITFRDTDVIHGSTAILDVQNVDYADVHDIRFEDIRVEYDSICLRPAIQQSEDDLYPYFDDADYMPQLMASVVTMIPEYSAGGLRRGRNYDIHYENIQVTAPRMPPSYFAGYDDQHESRNIHIRGLTLNGRRIRTLEEANVTLGAYASNVTIE